MVHLSNINDTRLQAGAQSTSASAFPSEATTAEPSVTVSVTYNRIRNKSTSVTQYMIQVLHGVRYPVYYTFSGNIQAMSLRHVKDTFIHPAIDLYYFRFFNNSTRWHLSYKCKYKCNRFNRGKWFKHSNIYRYKSRYICLYSRFNT